MVGPTFSSKFDPQTGLTFPLYKFTDIDIPTCAPENLTCFEVSCKQSYGVFSRNLNKCYDLKLLEKICVQADLDIDNGIVSGITIKGGCFDNGGELGIYSKSSLFKPKPIAIELRSSLDPFIAFSSIRDSKAFDGYFFWLSSFCLVISLGLVFLLFLYYKC